jgi:hypothetical protein
VVLAEYNMKKDLTGQTFGDLFVEGVSEVSRNGHYRYHVKCSCGTSKTVLGTHMIQGNTTHCGCKTVRGSANWQGYKGVGRTYWSQLARSSNGSGSRKAMEFSVTLEYIGDLLEAQNYKCALSGLPISAKHNSASLDRVDSSKGYLEGNVQWLHKDVNMMKRHYSQQYFTFLCRLISERTCEIVDLT